jgi:predicted CoA-substrate-specific enzyme activase
VTKRYFAGCDVGSTTGKAVIIDDDGILASSIVPREIDPEDTARLAIQSAIDSITGIAGIKDFTALVGTGYGRSALSFVNENVSEISCHALGAFSCNHSVKTIVDIGGQDVKGIAIKDDGMVLEFAMNDKCAAGTGRFFEAMSRIFRVGLEEFAEISLGSRQPIPVTAQCSVFAETEVISLLALKNSPADVAAGIELAVAKRCFTLLKRVGIRPHVTVTGGCAKNRGLIKALEGILKVPITPLSVDPQIIGALGAALYAKRIADK